MILNEGERVMKNEEHFYNELSNIPEVPGTAYPKIAKKIRNHELIIRSLWLMAACVVLVIGGFGYLQYENHKNEELIIEVAEELQTIDDYFNMRDIELSFTMYTVEDAESEDDISEIIDYFSGNNIEQDVEMYTIINNGLL